jgi:preprotein translocase subunit Sss1
MSSKKASSNSVNSNFSKNSSANNYQPISSKKADKLARKIARQEVIEAMKNPTKKGYWNWQRVVMVAIAFVIIFGFILYTVAPIAFR